MSEPNTHARAARAHLERATAPTFIDDTMRGLLARIEQLETGLRSFVLATTVDSDDDPLAKSTKAWIRGLASGALDRKMPTESTLSGSASRNADRSVDGGADSRLVEALRQFAVHEEFDYPGDAPVSCGMYCDICHQHVSDDRIHGHAETCLLAAH
jgi:hypothetical protein